MFAKSEESQVVRERIRLNDSGQGKNCLLGLKRVLLATVLSARTGIFAGRVLDVWSKCSFRSEG